MLGPESCKLGQSLKQEPTVLERRNSRTMHNVRTRLGFFECSWVADLKRLVASARRIVKGNMAGRLYDVL